MIKLNACPYCGSDCCTVSDNDLEDASGFVWVECGHCDYCSAVVEWDAPHTGQQALAEITKKHNSIRVIVTEQEWN